MRYPSLLTDLYELTMLAGYLEEGMAEKHGRLRPVLPHKPLRGGVRGFCRAGAGTGVSGGLELSAG